MGRGHLIVRAKWFAVVLGIVALLLPSAAVRGAPAVAKDGETIELEGTVALSEGLDVKEHRVVYVALRLDSPISYTDGLNSEDNIRVVKLLPPRTTPTALRGYEGLRVRVRGTVLYRWYGPSAAPVSEMVIVEEISAVPR
jgi:hypothetical protein